MGNYTLTFFTLAGKIVSSIFIGIFIVGTCWAISSFIVKSLYPLFRFNVKHYLFGFTIAFVSFVLFCFMALSSATLSGIQKTKELLYSELFANTSFMHEVTSLITQYEYKYSEGEINYDNLFSNLIYSILDNSPSLDTQINIDEFSTETMTEFSELITLQVSADEKTELITDFIINQYVGHLEKDARQAWWILLLTIVFLQFLFLFVMISRARKQKAFNDLSLYSDIDN